MYLEGYCSGGVIYFNIYGKETRPANREVSFESETLSVVDPKISFELSSELSLGTVSVQQGSNKGCVAQLWKIVKVDGVEQSREIFNKSRYQASPRVVTIGTKNATAESLAALKKAIATGDEAKVRSAAAAMKSKEEPEEEEPEDTEEDPSKGEDKKDDSQKEESNKEKPQKGETDKPSEGDSQKDDSQKEETPKDDNTSQKPAEDAETSQ